MGLRVIDTEATAVNIKKLFAEREMDPKMIAEYMGFKSPVAVYKWLAGKSIPSLDNLFQLSLVLDVTIEEIIVVKDIS